MDGPRPGRNCLGGNRAETETETSPEVRIGETSTDASSASVDVSQSVETKLSRSGMAPRFSNVVIRGSLAGEMAFYQIAPRILRLAG